MESEQSKRDRSPRFPYIGLRKSIEKIEVLYAKVRRGDALVRDIARDWGLSPTSSSTVRIIAALQAFGLVEDSGTGEKRKLRLTEDGVRVLSDQRPGVREELLAKAALRPTAIAEYARRWADGRPDDSHAISLLQFDGAFTEEAARIFLRVFDETSAYFPKMESSDDSDTGSPEKDAIGLSIDLPKAAPKPANILPKEPSDSIDDNYMLDVFSLDEGKATLTWPKILSPESAQDLEDWLTLLLRKIKRNSRGGNSRSTDASHTLIDDLL